VAADEGRLRELEREVRGAAEAEGAAAEAGRARLLIAKEREREKERGGELLVQAHCTTRQRTVEQDEAGAENRSSEATKTRDSKPADQGRGPPQAVRARDDDERKARCAAAVAAAAAAEGLRGPKL
jgi:hypothetical protein